MPDHDRRGHNRGSPTSSIVLSNVAVDEGDAGHLSTNVDCAEA